MSDTQTRRCAHCLRHRPISEYGLWRGAKDGSGLRSYCERCNSWMGKAKYRRRVGIIKPRNNDDFDSLIPGINPQNKMVIGKALKAIPFNGFAYDVNSKEVFPFSIRQINDSFCVFSLIRGDRSMSLNFNRFLEAPKLDIYKMLYRNGIRLEENQEKMQLSMTLLFNT